MPTDAEWRAQVEQWLEELRAEPILSTPTEYERGYDHATFETITRLTALLAVSSPQIQEEKGDTHVDSLRQSAQQATGGQITLIRTDVVRDLLLYLDDTDANGQFEAIAERFYRDTGWLRPGKSVPLEMASQYQGNQRDVAWREWCAQWRARLIAALSAGLPSVGEATSEGSVSVNPERRKEATRVDGQS